MYGLVAIVFGVLILVFSGYTRYRGVRSNGTGGIILLVLGTVTWIVVGGWILVAVGPSSRPSLGSSTSSRTRGAPVESGRRNLERRRRPRRDLARPGRSWGTLNGSRGPSSRAFQLFLPVQRDARRPPGLQAATANQGLRGRGAGVFPESTRHLLKDGTQDLGLVRGEAPELPAREYDHGRGLRRDDLRGTRSVVEQREFPEEVAGPEAGNPCWSPFGPRRGPRG